MTEKWHPTAPEREGISALEHEAILLIREIKAQATRPCILFSGGKDSIVLTHLVRLAFPKTHFHTLPFELLHIDTGHNFHETIVFRDQFVSRVSAKLIVEYVEDSIREGKCLDPCGPDAVQFYTSRNRIQSITLVDAIGRHGFDAVLGGARRDEEKSRSKERFISYRQPQGGWNPTDQQPEAWNLHQLCLHDGMHARVFPLSNWREKHIWQYIALHDLELPSLYYAHQRSCIVRSDGSMLADHPVINKDPKDALVTKMVRFRTMGDITCTAPMESHAANPTEVLAELSSIQFSERALRIDDTISDAALEDRKKEGYF